MAFRRPSVQFEGRASLRAWQTYLAEWLDEHEVSESGVILVTALIVGIGAGLGAVVFRWLIAFFQRVAFDGVGGLLEGISPLHLMIIPALGGAIYGPMIYKLAREAKGHGVPEVMEAVALRGGRIRPRVAAIKALASGICIGTGGSVGREGPIAQIGSALGSTIGQLLGLSDERVRNLVACGAAGGIAATFNAPIAGALFSLEIILGQFHAVYFGAVVISSVTADVIAQFFEGGVRAFSVPAYTLVSPWELVFYVLLGFVAALASVTFSRSLYLSEDLWDRFHFPEYFKPVLGGLVLGVLGILTFKLDGFPRIFGVGYSSIDHALFGQLTVRVTLALFFFKLLATITTLGAGGSGGVFAPSLFMGAMMGEAFGQAVHHLFPAITAPSGAYALVGMSAFFAGAAHAPVTAIIILFEMTGDYLLILPLMLATVVSTLIARVISRESIYTVKLSRRGVHLDRGQDIDVMREVSVGEAMTTGVDCVNLDMPLEELASEFATSHHHGFPILDDDGILVGVVSLQDLDMALSEGPIAGKTVADIATTEGLLVAFPHEPMGVALNRMGARDVSRLPVVEDPLSRRLLGVVRRRDIVRAYNVAVVRRVHQKHREQAMSLGEQEGASFVHFHIVPDSPSAGRAVSEIGLPEACIIVSVQRADQLNVVHGDTILEPGDRVTVFADHDCVDDVRRRLVGGAAGDVSAG
jgi:CIC family chloride channel protein